jgi:DNA-binding transcriptional regulator YiaG
MSTANLPIAGEILEDNRRIVLAAIVVLRQLLHALQHALEAQPDGLTWLTPSLECRYSVPWNWDQNSPQEPAREVSGASIGEVLNGIEIFSALTHGTAWKIHCGVARPLVTEDQKVLLEVLPKEERRALLDEITEPFTLVIGQAQAEPVAQRRNRYVLPGGGFEAKVDGTTVHIGIQFEVHPFVLDHDARRVYYPVIVALSYSTKPEGLGSWLKGFGHQIWDTLYASVDEVRASLARVPLKADDAPEVSEAVMAQKLNTDAAEIGPRRTYPERRRSLMSPVPMPRAIGREAATLAVTRGLGRMFAGYTGVPDLDINGPIATAEARRCCVAAFEEQVAVRGEKYERRDDNGAAVFTLQNCSWEKAGEIWASAAKALNKGDGGPGVEAIAPAIEVASRFESGIVVTQTRLVFWPDAARSDRPPARFRGQSSPGYVALLERQGSRPYFADGWLWVQRSREREGFRIGGLSTLLFHEGRRALERIAEHQIITGEADLSRLLRSAPPPGPDDEKAIRELRAEIVQLRNWLASLSVYDVSHDLILCLLEAFHRQRDHWAKQEVIVRGQAVSTAPYRILLLNPAELRLRLDPAKKWGDNWRSRISEGLAALATFERQTRTEVGRKIDFGDRLVRRVVDGLRSPDLPTGSDSNPDLGLVRLLRRNGCVPVDAFFIEVSVDFMARLVTWVVDDGGRVRWGQDALHFEGGRERAGTEFAVQPYYHHSPRLLAFGNLEDWPVRRKLLASAILQEKTPRKGKKRVGAMSQDSKLTVQIEGKPYIVCNGGAGRGYKVKTWMERAGYDVAGEFGKALAEFVNDVEALEAAIALRVELGPRDSTVNGVEALRRLASDSTAAARTILRAHLPVDLEERLRFRLAEKANIEAVETHAEAAQEQMSGNQLRTARLQSGTTQGELASALGISQMLVSKWEQGKTPIPEGRAEAVRIALESLNRGGP